MQTTISVKHELSDSNKLELSKELVEKINNFGNVIAAKKAALAEFKTMLSELDRQIQDISRKIMLGYYWEERLCDVEDDLENNMRFFKDPETGEVLKEEPLDDSQPNMFQKLESGATLNESGTTLVDSDDDDAPKHPSLVTEEGAVE